MGLKYTTIIRNVKYPRIEIKPSGEVKVIVPPNQDPAELVRLKSEWINKKLREIDEIRNQFKGLSDKLLLNGEFYEVIRGEEFSVNPKFKFILLPENDLKVLKGWLRNQLRKELDFKVRLFASILDVKYRKIYIRFQKTKWASCSKKGNLSFNLMLMALPESLRDYVIIHELAHLRESRHTGRFWEIVGTYYPDYKKAEIELRKYWLLLEWNEVWKNLRKV
ncbi:M48 family metallopeptidase [Thermococcus gorgonarius]|uniref:Zinc-dependent protease n=1 Tax=Thermococcus gorgonarius TaxID=71997 RepID=A0A2Z2MFD9_THEGO|nr:SprT family zinc-dependent metalloprotease [Thermococcus gorgonarius]ASJ01171.1 zinc-dependent protease [Thermococcus gorgonarius]